MAPKFRGGSDDWMDDEEIVTGVARPKKGAGPPAARSRALDPALGNATIAEVFMKQARARFDDGKEVLCNYRMAALITKGEKNRERSPVAVGDRVRVEGDIITGLCERTNRLVRPAPDKDPGIVHVLVANIEVLVIVAAAHEPEFSPGLVDRFMIAAQAQGISVLLCINKVDLLAPSDRKPWEIYREIGAEIVEASAKRGDNIELMRQALGTRSAAFCGHSGVGKTSLLRAMLESDIGRVASISHSTGKGKHTTTGALLLSGPNNVRWIDTPGIREFGLVDIKADELLQYFPEIAGAVINCAAGCQHTEESDCAVRGLERYASFARVRDSLLAGEG